MKLIIIKDDQAVYQDGEAVYGIDLSDLPADFHALHWDDATNIGDIEWKTITIPNQSVNSENEIDSALGVGLQDIIKKRSDKILEGPEANPEADAATEAWEKHLAEVNG